MIQRKKSNHKSWDFKGKDGWSISVALYHYRCQRIVLHDTKAKKISDTVELSHHTIATPVVNPEYQVLYGITTLTDSLTDAPTDQSDAQLQAIIALRNASASWTPPNETLLPTDPIPLPSISQTRRYIRVQKIF